MRLNSPQVYAALAVSWMALGFVAGACNPANRAFPLGPEPFRNEAAGYSIRYPLGWQHHVECWGMGRPCYDRFDPPAGWPVFWGSVLVQWDPNDKEKPCPQSVSPKTLLQLSWEADPDNDDAILLRIEATTADGQAAAFWDRTGLDWTEPYPFQDRLVIVCTEDRVFGIDGFSERSTWDTFLPTFEPMLATMEFFEPAAEP